MPDIQSFNALIKKDDRIHNGLDPDFIYPRRSYSTIAAFRKNVPSFMEAVGINFVGFEFLSFPTRISLTESRRRLNSLRRHHFGTSFGHTITVIELTASYRFHIHLLVQCSADIRTGFGFDAYKSYINRVEAAGAGGPRLTLRERRVLRNAIPANDSLQALWHTMDHILPSLGFGASDLFPIETNGAAVARYLSKGFFGSLVRLPGARRLVTYSRGCPRAVPPGWRPPSRWFELRLTALMRVFGFTGRAQLKERLGPRWAYGIMELIRWLEFDCTEHWPDLPVFQLAPLVRDAILHTGRLEHYLGDLLHDVEAIVSATSFPTAPPPPPGLAPI